MVFSSLLFVLGHHFFGVKIGSTYLQKIYITTTNFVTIETKYLRSFTNIFLNSYEICSIYIYIYIYIYIKSGM